MAACSVADFEEEVSCIICSNIFTNPRILKCMHTFCAQCTAELSKGRNYVSCPICKVTSSTREIKHDFNKQRLVDLHSKVSSTERQMQIAQKPIDLQRQLQSFQAEVARNRKTLEKNEAVFNDLLSLVELAIGTLDGYDQRVQTQKEQAKREIDKSAQEWVRSVHDEEAKLSRQVDVLLAAYETSVTKDTAATRDTLQTIKGRIMHSKGVIATILNNGNLEILGDSGAVGDINANATDEAKTLDKEIEGITLPEVGRKVITLDLQVDFAKVFDGIAISLRDEDSVVTGHISSVLTASTSGLTTWRNLLTALVETAQLNDNIFDSKLVISSLCELKQRPRGVVNTGSHMWVVLSDGTITKHATFGYQEGTIHVRNPLQSGTYKALSLACTDDGHITAACLQINTDQGTGMGTLIEIDPFGIVKEKLDDGIHIELRNHANTILALTAPASTKLQMIKAFRHSSENGWEKTAEMKLNNAIYGGFCLQNSRLVLALDEYPYGIHVYNSMGRRVGSYGGMATHSPHQPLRPSLLLASGDRVLMADDDRLLVRSNQGRPVQLKVNISKPVAAAFDCDRRLCVVCEQDRKLYVIKQQEWWQSPGVILFIILASLVAIVGIIFAMVMRTPNHARRW